MKQSIRISAVLGVVLACAMLGMVGRRAFQARVPAGRASPSPGARVADQPEPAEARGGEEDSAARATAPGATEPEADRLEAFRVMLGRWVQVRYDAGLEREARAQIHALYAAAPLFRAELARLTEADLKGDDLDALEKLISLMASLKDPGLCALLVETFAALSQDPLTRDRHLASSTAGAEWLSPRAGLMARGLLAMGEGAATSGVLNCPEGLREGEAFQWLVIEVALAGAWDALAATVRVIESDGAANAHLRAIALMVRGAAGEPIDVRALDGLLEGAEPSDWLLHRTVKAALEVLPPATSVAFLRARTAASAARPFDGDALRVFGEFKSTARGKRVGPDLIDACASELDRAGSALERRLLALLIWTAGVDGARKETIERLKSYLRRPALDTVSVEESAPRSNIMSIVATTLDSQEVLEWAQRALATNDIGVLGSCIRRLCSKGVASGYILSGAPRAQVVDLLESVLAWSPAVHNASVFAAAGRLWARADLSELTPRILEVRGKVKDSRWFESFLEETRSLEEGR